MIRFKVETRGGLPEDAVLNVKMGVRRFLQKAVDVEKGVSYRYNGTILIGMKNPFYINSDIQSMSIWGFRKEKGKINWEYKEDELFSNLFLSDLSLQPQEVLENPLTYIKGNSVEALVVYNDKTFLGYNRSKALPGLGIPERSSLFNLVKESLSELKPIQPLLDIKGWQFSSEVFPLLHSYEEGTVLPLEVWSYSEMGKRLEEYLLKEGIVEKEGNFLVLNAKPRIYLRLIERDAEGVIHALDSEKYGNKAEERYLKKLENYFRRIHGRKKKEFTLSLIEIGRPKDYGRNDPKSALRKGFADAKRISQFIHSEKDTTNFKERLLNSFYDLLTDSGFFPKRYGNLHGNGIHLSFGFLTEFKGKCFPVMTKLQGTSLQIRMFGSSNWMSFQEALFYSSNLRNSDLLNRRKPKHREKIRSFFIGELKATLESTEEDITVIVDHRLKYFWNLFTNPKVDSDSLFCGMGIEKHKNRLLFIRINNTEEVPQYRINPKGKQVPNRRAGIFKDSAGIYYLVGGRPDTMRYMSPRDIKLDNPRKLLTQQRNIELLPIGYQEEEKNNEAIRVVYKMRNLIIAYKVHTILPYPLHLNHKLRKYVTFIKNERTERKVKDEFDDRVMEYVQLELEL